ncbi:hypothetical protein G6O69_25755 [Pseudenhygromyxa sp. WMMC2535]|uniref:hypothetical protein n=1 Tax=Pseudenhygromyxa sp. WMMC2535 TaxID=2712867 RepID=UPI001555F7B6|nr:hypothetical protein [Pseudenhygromyxa sp. WMMC2535]NVB41271.1 hypothetical protein [Pseudenhygromyxa sp. WMMC2535]
MTNARVPFASCLCLLLAAAACSDEGGRESTSIYGDDGGLTLGGDEASSLDSGDDTDGDNGGSNDEDDDTSGGGGIKLDTLGGDGMGSADDGGSSEGCQAIDFLFVIDNSGSMGDNQQNLINSFPGFISKIQEAIAEVDSYHIMVVDTDEYWNDCTVECAFPFPLCTFDGIDGCDGAPTVCDETLGAGVNFPLGDDASNQYCELTGGQRYITPAEPFDLLPQKFTCIASVGTDGDSSEMPMSALTQAIGPTLNGAGGCNSGFLRDDAVLVVTIITDEEDSDSPGTPAGWYQNIVAQKIGDGSGVVVLGLINDMDADTPLCPAESQDPEQIRTFIDMFPNHIRGSVCDADYSPFFEQAVDLINSTCDEFVPVG